MTRTIIPAAIVPPDRLIVYRDREHWLEGRAGRIGASDSPAILGASKYSSPYKVWAIKTGKIEPDEVGEAAFWGSQLETAIIEGMAQRDEYADLDLLAWPQNVMVQHDLFPWMTCTPDAVIFDKDGEHELVQIKTASQYLADQWEGDEPPLAYHVQVQHELAVTGLKKARIACLIGGQRLVVREIERNEQFISHLEKKLMKFMSLVESDTPPEVDFSEATTAALNARFPKETDDEPVHLPDSLTELDELYETLSAEAKGIERDKELIKNRIKEALGEHAVGITTSGATWTWKTQQRAERTIPASEIRVLTRRKPKGA